MKSRKTILVTGSHGFVGQNLVKTFEPSFSITRFDRGKSISINEDFVIHLAGLAHDFNSKYNFEDYLAGNTNFTKEILNAFINSNSKVFIFLSSVKASADRVVDVLTEDSYPSPVTHYGKSKLLAEKHILSVNIPEGKKIYILRPCMIHGPGNKGNLNHLFSIISKGFPWPLGLFENSRSYLSIENLCFVIKELIDRDDIPSGVYNVSDDTPKSTNDIIRIIADASGRKVRIFYCNKFIIRALAKIGDYLKLPLNSERLHKLTESYIVSNNKIKNAIGKPFPVSSEEGLVKTFKSFSSNG